MFHTALRIVQHKANAEDVMQEAFISAFNGLKNAYNDKLNIEAWLRRIVINKSIDFLREKTQSLSFTSNENLGDLTDTMEDIEDEEQVKMEVNTIKKAIQNLPEGYRLICTLYLFEGYDHEEIGTILQISPSTSRSQYYRAKQQILRQLKNTTSYA